LTWEEDVGEVPPAMWEVLEVLCAVSTAVAFPWSGLRFMTVADITVRVCLASVLEQVSTSEAVIPGRWLDRCIQPAKVSHAGLRTVGKTPVKGVPSTCAMGSGCRHCH